MVLRVSETDEAVRAVREAVRLFSSREGEGAEGCACSLDFIDSVTVCPGFVENVDAFVDIMDRISNGRFLKGEESGLGEEWVELDWLKAKGYYGIEAFVANWLEVALRFSWMNFNGGKKRGVKLKEKLNVAGVAANVYWRKKGCVDWWVKLDAATRRNVYSIVLGKGAKPLTAEILEMMNSSEDHKSMFASGAESSPWIKNVTSLQSAKLTVPGVDTRVGPFLRPALISGNYSSLASMLNGLFILQNISAILLACQHSEFDQENVLFSSLESITTVSDCVYRKIRGLLMVISLDCTKIELFEEENVKIRTKKLKEKVCGPGRKKKGGNQKAKRLNPNLKSSKDDSKIDTPSKGQFHGVISGENIDTTKSASEARTVSTKEHGEGFAEGNSQGASRKGRKRRKEAKKCLTTDPAEVWRSQTRSVEVISSFISQSGTVKDIGVSENSFVANSSDYLSASTEKHFLGLSTSTCLPTGEDKLGQSNEQDCIAASVEVSKCVGLEQNELSNQETEVNSTSSCLDNTISAVDCSAKPPLAPIVEIDNVTCDEDNVKKVRGCLSESDSCPGLAVEGIRSQDGVTPMKELKGRRYYNSINSLGCRPYEWPAEAPTHLSSFNSHLPPATDRLHLDVGYNWQNHFHEPFTVVRNRPTENGCNQILSQPLPMSLDWPLMVRNSCGLPVTCSYDPGYMLRKQSSFHQGFSVQSVQHNAATSDDERTYTGDYVDLSDLTNSYEVTDEQENQCMSEEEFEVHTVSGMDYSQYFGGGVMYWNPADHPGNSFSRPPSLSSDDSSWAWREADMSRTVDDMVAFSSSYSTNGLASPSAASFCSPFDPLAPGVGYVIQGSDVAGKLMHSTSAIANLAAEENVAGSFSSLPSDGEVKTPDSLPYPILRPIIVPNISRERSRSEFKRSHHELQSPCVPLNRRDHPRIKRPPSPVVLCVPRAPHPPPPSPIGDPRKRRGFPTVRSGSSSPRHWGVRGFLHDGINFEESCILGDGNDVVWPSWRNKTIPAHGMIQPIPGTLLQDRLIALSHLTRDQEHPDVKLPLQPPESLSCQTSSGSVSLMHSVLHEEIDAFWKQVAVKNFRRKPYINWAVKRVSRSLQVLWPRSRTNIFGSNSTGLSLPTSDVDLVVCLPPVRNLEPIKEAGILEGRNGIKETCLQHAARYLANQEWVKNDSLKMVENTAIPIIMLVVEVPWDFINPVASTLSIVKEDSAELPSEEGCPLRTNMVNLESSDVPTYSELNNGDAKGMNLIRIDISFKSPSHTGLQTTELVKELTEQLPAAIPLALVLKQFLADRSLDQSYSGGLSSYCLVLLITRFLQHEHHHGRPINQNFGSLLIDFFFFFGNVFDPRQMRISVRGSGVYVNRERGCSIDPIYIDDPLFPANNVGRNCFRIHQCIKAFADAYSTLANEQNYLPGKRDSSTGTAYNLLQKIIPSIGLL